MRTLVRWSLSSLRMTTPRPWRAEPSRCMACSRRVLEVAGVDQLQARRLDRKPQEPSTRTNDRRSHLRPHIALRIDAHVIAGRGFNRFHARYSLDLVRNALTFSLDVDIVADAENLSAKLAHGAKKRNVALVEQRHAVADALYAIEQMRRQQHADAAILEVADDVQELGGCQRTKPQSRFVAHRPPPPLLRDLS